jgi:rhamnogalacturonyl hydrolase YesR
MKIEFPPNIPTTEFSQEFAQGMANRMAVSYCKYGAVADAYPSKVDAIASLKKRLERYEETGNTEWLMDVGNFAMIEFMHPRSDRAHFRATDAVESPGRVWTNGLEHAGSNDNREARRIYRRDGD